MYITWFLALAQFLAIPLVRFGVIRIRYVLPAALSILAYEVMRGLHTASASDRRGFAILFCLSVSLVAIGSHDEPAFIDWEAFVLLVIGWSLALTLLRVVPSGGSVRLPSPSVASALLLMAAASALWVAFRAVGHPVIIDEVLYLLQSHYIRHAPFMRPLDSQLASFFLLRQSYVFGEYFNGQYPPGWPLILSLADPRTLWLVPFTLHLVCLAATYAFGRAIASRETGALAAVLLSVNGIALYWSTTFFPHVFVAALALLSGTLMVSSVTASFRRRSLVWGFAGLLLGFGCATRPLTGITLAGTLWLWLLMSEKRIPKKTLMTATAVACGGALVPIGWLMYYNWQTTGSAFQFGYDVANHGLHALGFGIRGAVVYKLTGLPFEDVTMFGPARAFINFGGAVHAALADFWPTYFIFPLLFLVSRAGLTLRWGLLAPFALLPGAYFFYPIYSGSRFYFELLPFAMVGTASLVHRLAQRRKAEGVALAGLLLATMLVDASRKAVDRRKEYEDRNVFFEAVERVRVEHPKLLVFVQDRWPGTKEHILESLYWYNLESFPSDVIVARDLGERDCGLLQRFPNHFAVLVLTHTAGQLAPQVRPIECSM
jgi:hypothetical protein